MGGALSESIPDHDEENFEPSFQEQDVAETGGEPQLLTLGAGETTLLLRAGTPQDVAPTGLVAETNDCHLPLRLLRPISQCVQFCTETLFPGN